MSYTDKELIQKISEIRKYNDDHLTRCEDEVLRSAAMRIAELQSRLESLEKDAARYHWLLEEVTESRYYPRLDKSTLAIVFETDSKDISEAIDTAMQSANKGE